MKDGSMSQEEQILQSQQSCLECHLFKSRWGKHTSSQTELYEAPPDNHHYWAQFEATYEVPNRVLVLMYCSICTNYNSILLGRVEASGFSPVILSPQCFDVTPICQTPTAPLSMPTQYKSDR